MVVYFTIYATILAQERADDGTERHGGEKSIYFDDGMEHGSMESIHPENCDSRSTGKSIDFSKK
jgi:hypothetical protein